MNRREIAETEVETTVPVSARRAGVGCKDGDIEFGNELGTRS
jgi:hypothetical protein